MSTIQESVAKLLSGKRDTLSSEQCAEQIEKITKRLEVIRARTADIHSWPTGRGKFGLEREKIAETGSPEDLIALNREEELLSAEDISLCHQRDALRKRKETAINEEAPGLAKAAIKRLGPALKLVEVAKTACDKATAKLEDIQAEIAAARRTADLANVDCPHIKYKLFEQLAVALNWYWFESYEPLQPQNGSRALHRRRIILTDYKPEMKPIFPTLGQAGRDQWAAEAPARRKAQKKREAYVKE